MNSKIHALVVGLGLILLSGCSVKLKPENAVPEALSIMGTHRSSVEVNVIGGMSHFPAPNFAEAIESTLKKYKVFEEIVSDDGHYQLDVSVDNVDMPAVGFNMEVYLTTTWKLFDIRSNEVVWQDIISTTGKKTVGDAFVGMTRVRIASEEAAKQNIRRGVEELAKLNLR